MYCPRCGKRQAAEAVRFCVKCGLPLESTKLALSDEAAAVDARSGMARLSPRTRGILQGLAIIPISAGAWLLLNIFYEAVLGAGIMGGVYALFTLILLVALCRIAYALLYQEGGSKSPDLKSTPIYVAPNQEVVGNTKQFLDRPVEIGPSPGELEFPTITENTTRKLKVEK